MKTTADDSVCKWKTSYTRTSQASSHNHDKSLSKRGCFKPVTISVLALLAISYPLLSTLLDKKLEFRGVENSSDYLELDSVLSLQQGGEGGEIDR